MLKTMSTVSLNFLTDAFYVREIEQLVVVICLAVIPHGSPSVMALSTTCLGYPFFLNTPLRHHSSLCCFKIEHIPLWLSV